MSQIIEQVIWRQLTLLALVVITLSLQSSSKASPLSPFTGKCESLAAVSTIDAHDIYANFGDLNIGGFIMASTSQPPMSCSKTFRKGSIAIEVSEAIAYAVKLVNEDPYLLPNVSLGFVLVNDCSNTNVALAKALQFLPVLVHDPDTNDVYISNSQLSTYVNNSRTSVRLMPHYDIVGAISPIWSDISIAISQLFSTARIPLLGSVASSDELSDKSRYPYFLRVVAPDRFQVEAMLAFIQNNGWSYISVLYAYGSYGEKAYDSIRNLAPSYNICIATHHRMNSQSDFDYVVTDLLNYPTARVVILFIYLSEVHSVFKSINKKQARGLFIWIGGDGLGSSFRSDFKGFEDDLQGTLVFSYHKSFLPGLYDYIDKIRVNTTNNPWLKPIWENLLGCSFSQGTCDRGSSILNASDFAFSKASSLYVDAVMVYAHAITKLLNDLCPGMSGPETRACINGDVLLQYMKNVSFVGYSGHIAFDQNGDVRDKYEIIQIGMGYNKLQYSKIASTYGMETRTVALYSIKTKEIVYTENEISWDHLVPLPRLVPISPGTQQKRVLPESVCSRPCLLGEQKIIKTSRCCWDCRKCRGNERLVNVSSSCEECPPFSWPDPDTDLTTCREIDLSFPSKTEASCIILLTLSLVAIFCTVVVCVCYIIFRQSQVLKASSRELSFIQLVAIVFGYITVILLQLQPSHAVCGTLFFTFCLSFTCLYSPLLVKAVRVYRIFLGSSKHQKRPRFINWHSQVFMTMFLVSIQILLCLVSYIILRPTAKKTQPVSTEKFVELSCDMTLLGLASFLVYNLVLVFLCSVFAFKTRKLPDNYNESWFIFICVTTTMVIWVAFAPMYFTANRESMRKLMFSMTILLNHTVALVFLFIPKIFVAVFGPVETKTSFRFQNSNTPGHISTNRIFPSISESSDNQLKVKTESQPQNITLQVPREKSRALN